MGCRRTRSSKPCQTKPNGGMRAKTSPPVRRDALAFELVYVPTLALRLSLRPQLVRRLVDQRRIPFVKIGRLVRFDLAAIEAWLALQRVEPVGASRSQLEHQGVTGPDTRRQFSRSPPDRGFTLRSWNALDRGIVNDRDIRICENDIRSVSRADDHHRAGRADHRPLPSVSRSSSRRFRLAGSKNASGDTLPAVTLTS